MTEYRRMSDKIIYDMSNNIGELNGKLDSFLENQKYTNDNLMKLIKEHERTFGSHNRRLHILESDKKSLLAWMAGAATSGGGIGAILTTLFK